jgi:hypothetical protein
MKALFATTLLSTMIFAAPALAQESLGVGVVAGDTNGITLKIPAVGSSTVDLSAGVDGGADEARFRADWQQPILVIGNSNLVVPLYVGVGGFVESNDVGVRAPFGAAFQLQRTPVEIFAQTGLEAALVSNNNNNGNLGVSAAVGVRVYGF